MRFMVGRKDTLIRINNPVKLCLPENNYFVVFVEDSTFDDFDFERNPIVVFIVFKILFTSVKSVTPANKPTIAIDRRITNSFILIWLMSTGRSIYSLIIHTRRTTAHVKLTCC